MGSDESRHVFNVSSIVRGKVTGQCPQTTIFEGTGKPKPNRTSAYQPNAVGPNRLMSDPKLNQLAVVSLTNLATPPCAPYLALKLAGFIN